MRKFFNMKCRKCGKIISVEKDFIRNEIPQFGYIIKKEQSVHKCKLLQTDESTFLDLISFSDTPLKDAEEVYYYENTTRNI